MWEGHHHISGQVRATTATMARDASDNGTTLVAQEEWLMVKMAVAQVATRDHERRATQRKHKRELRGRGTPAIKQQNNHATAAVATP